MKGTSWRRVSLHFNKRGEGPQTLNRLERIGIIYKRSRLWGMKELVTLRLTQLRIKLSQIMVERTFLAILGNLREAQSMRNVLMIMLVKSIHTNKML